MNISNVTNAQRVGSIVLSSSHDKKLSIVVDENLSRRDFTDNTGRVYFITVNGEIKKIGGSQSKGGIKATISAYLGGFAKGMSPRSYCGWNYMRQQIEQGNEVEFWFILAPTITATVPSMSGYREQEIALDYHAIESACVSEYLEQEEDYPFLNIQESGRKWRETGLLEGYPGIIEA
jgi:hypothetical protein